MNSLGFLIKRNIKLFFKDKGVFFTSLITPLILLILYVEASNISMLLFFEKVFVMSKSISNFACYYFLLKKHIFYEN